MGLFIDFSTSSEIFYFGSPLICIGKVNPILKYTALRLNLKCIFITGNLIDLISEFFWAVIFLGHVKNIEFQVGIRLVNIDFFNPPNDDFIILVRLFPRIRFRSK